MRKVGICRVTESKLVKTDSLYIVKCPPEKKENLFLHIEINKNAQLKFLKFGGNE